MLQQGFDTSKRTQQEKQANMKSQYDLAHRVKDAQLREGDCCRGRKEKTSLQQSLIISLMECEHKG